MQFQGYLDNLEIGWSDFKVVHAAVSQPHFDNSTVIRASMRARAAPVDSALPSTSLIGRLPPSGAGAADLGGAGPEYRGDGARIPIPAPKVAGAGHHLVHDLIDAGDVHAGLAEIRGEDDLRFEHLELILQALGKRPVERGQHDAGLRVSPPELSRAVNSAPRSCRCPHRP